MVFLGTKFGIELMEKFAVGSRGQRSSASRLSAGELKPNRWRTPSSPRKCTDLKKSYLGHAIANRFDVNISDFGHRYPIVV
jgi:hypothetical protein